MLFLLSNSISALFPKPRGKKRAGTRKLLSIADGLTHIRNPRPRTKQIWLWCDLRTDQISPCSRSEPHFLEPDSGVGTAGAGLTRILEPCEVPQSSNHYPTEHSDDVWQYTLKSILRDVGLLFENAPSGRRCKAFQKNTGLNFPPKSMSTSSLDVFTPH